MNADRVKCLCIALTLCLASLSGTASAQTEYSSNKVTAPNGLYVEVFGQGYFPTANYERLLIISTPHNVALRVGVGVWIGLGGSGFVFPLSASYLLGSNHKVEVGAGIVFVSGNSEDELAAGAFSALIGYRYQPIDGGFIFRIGFTPLVDTDFDFILPWGGLSLGYAF